MQSPGLDLDLEVDVDVDVDVDLKALDCQPLTLGLLTDAL
jgi:hypothetical protein